MIITDEQLYRYLLGDQEVGKTYISRIPEKYRKQDTNESFGTFEKNGVIRWKDHGLASQYGNEASNLLQYMWELPLDQSGWRQAKALIEGSLGRQIQLGAEGPNPPGLRRGKVRSGDCVPYLNWSEDFTDYELSYWQRYGITAQELLREQIYALRELRWANSPVKTMSTPADPAFLYIFNRNPLAWKIYRPLNTSNQKFRQWNIEDVIEGLHDL